MGVTLADEEAGMDPLTRLHESTFSDPAFRGNEFAPPVEVGPDADDVTRLVAFLGRQP